MGEFSDAVSITAISTKKQHHGFAVVLFFGGVWQGNRNQTGDPAKRTLCGERRNGDALLRKPLAVFDE